MLGPPDVWQWIGTHAVPLFFGINIAWTICLILLAIRLHVISLVVLHVKRNSEQRGSALQKLERRTDEHGEAIHKLNNTMNLPRCTPPESGDIPDSALIRREIELLIADIGGHEP
ncbi:MAG TPA: hypothetical protein VHU23_09595 [Rhizomicrobium sp.]|jgi:hypothetical protein|nr:hypothetical protein [Rhizomicrobium sp.]